MEQGLRNRIEKFESEINKLASSNSTRKRIGLYKDTIFILLIYGLGIWMEWWIFNSTLIFGIIFFIVILANLKDEIIEYHSYELKRKLTEQTKLMLGITLEVERKYVKLSQEHSELKHLIHRKSKDMEIEHSEFEVKVDSMIEILDFLEKKAISDKKT